MLSETKPVQDLMPLLQIQNLSMMYGSRIGCQNINFDLWPGEVLGIVGESGSGKSTLLSCISGQQTPTSGQIKYNAEPGKIRDLFNELSEPERRSLMRTDWAFVHQNPRDGLRMGVSAGANIGERLMA
ncbi:MAG: ATP-binding cassette domain-containing protein, partial [Alphaproteobacteria bacterium]|nr:ATP-binding cassette domain-containing protein [Alphaproteobacteria bacterium]